MRLFAFPHVCLPALALLLVACAGERTRPAPAGAHAVLAVLETTDLHANVLGYDYFRLAPDASLGLERTATLIAQARREFANTLLLDDGDAIQGSALADYQAQPGALPCSRALAIYRAMNLLGYDGGTLGNHEFNYGLAYLNQVTGNQFQVEGVDPARARCAGPAFPLVLANVYSVQSGAPLFAPYRILDKKIQAFGADGTPFETVLKVGIIGFAPAPIMDWDRRWLDGKVRVEGVRESALKFIPEMRARGAQLIVALSHGGLDGAAYAPSMENASLHLAGVAGIDAMLIGHAHQVFPNPASALAQFNLPEVDKVKGLVKGVPTVMAGQWGKQLGVIGLHLVHDGAAWRVDRRQTTVEARSTQLADKSYVAPDAVVTALVAAEHAATLEYVSRPIGATEFRMSTYFADAGDSSASAIVNLAQADYVRRHVQANLPQYAQLPVLSMAAPFKAGKASAHDFTDVRAGSLALNNAADLYLYPNTLEAVKLTGAELTAWLEAAAARFNTIDPTSGAPQDLVNPGFASYNFDSLSASELRYEIDVTRPPGARIGNLRYRGVALDPAAEFLVATNNYRANGGGGFPGLDGSKTVLAAPDTNRDVVIAYIRRVGTLTRAAHGGPASWSFKKVKTAGPVLLRAAPDLLGLAREAGLHNVSLWQADNGGGYALYRVDLSN
jgi:2',3'-cyclic-nucleotide 2'-phosphodiesterase/3'-nucleotidase